MDFVSFENRVTTVVPIKRNEFREKLKKIIEFPFYECGVNIFVALNIASILAKDMLELSAAHPRYITVWIWIQIAVSWIFLAELIMILYAIGPIKAIMSRHHLKIEVVFQIVSIGSLVYFLSSGRRELILRSLEIISILRGFRLFTLFSEMEQWEIILKTSTKLLKPLYSLLLVTYILFL